MTIFPNHRIEYREEEEEDCESKQYALKNDVRLKGL
jgi:hypothetical protein